MEGDRKKDRRYYLFTTLSVELGLNGQLLLSELVMMYRMQRELARIEQKADGRY